MRMRRGWTADGAPAAPALGGRLGVVVGTEAAARCVARLANGTAPMVVTSGGDAGRARRGAQQLAAGGVRAIISFGPAVGLAPVLRPGDLVVADSVVLPSGATIATDALWRAELVRRLSLVQPHLKVARLAGRDRLATSADEKRRAFRATFAAALDSESHAVAEVAAAAGLPFLAVRAVADPAEQNRPAAAYGAAHGQLCAPAVLARLLGRPWELPSVWRFARSGQAARATLRQVAALGPSPFAFALEPTPSAPGAG